MVVIEMENGKKIKIELYPEIAPITCANFEKLVKELSLIHICSMSSSSQR